MLFWSEPDRWRSVVYQMLHPWHWLTYGNNATGVGTIGAILAGCLAWRSYAASKRQLSAALQQLKMAQDQFLEASRPHLILEAELTHIEDVGYLIGTLKNTGGGRAVKVIGRAPIAALNCSSLPAGSSVTCIIDPTKRGDPDDHLLYIHVLYFMPNGPAFLAEFMIDLTTRRCLTNLVCEQSAEEGEPLYRGYLQLIDSLPHP